MRVWWVFLHSRQYSMPNNRTCARLFLSQSSRSTSWVDLLWRSIGQHHQPTVGAVSLVLVSRKPCHWESNWAKTGLINCDFVQGSMIRYILECRWSRRFFTNENNAFRRAFDDPYMNGKHFFRSTLLILTKKKDIKSKLVSQRFFL